MTINIAKVKIAVREFHERVTEIERVMNTLESVLYMSPECDLHNAICALISGYNNSLCEYYSIDGWLGWWWLECDLGNNPKQASLAGEELRTIATIDDLVKLICDDITKDKK